MSDDEVTACRQVFDVVDEDGSGSIGAAELQKLLRLLRLPARRSEVLRMIAEIDKDGNGEVDFEEFLQVCTFMSTLILLMALVRTGLLKRQHRSIIEYAWTLPALTGDSHHTALLVTDADDGQHALAEP